MRNVKATITLTKLVLLILILIVTKTNTYAREKQIALNGFGTYTKPFLIKNEEDFYTFQDLILSGKNFSGEYIKLTANLDFKGKTIHQIGKIDLGQSFNGVFDGNGHTIKGFKIDQEDSAGLFSQLDGCVKNLKIDGSVTSQNKAASFANKGTGVIMNCISYCSLSGTSRNQYANSPNILIRNSVYIEKSMPLERMTKTIAELNEEGIDSFFMDINYTDLNEFCIKNGQIDFSGEHLMPQGWGTEDAPFIVSCENELVAIYKLSEKGYQFVDQYFYQVNDIRVDKELSIGKENAPFLGKYDGMGHSIASSKSIFSYVGGEIKNVVTSGGRDGGIFDRCMPNAKVVNVYCYDENAASIEKMYDQLYSLVEYNGYSANELYILENIDEAPASCFQDVYLQSGYEYFKGKGTYNDPYRISNLSDLVYLRELCASGQRCSRKYFEQTQDIDFSKVKYWPGITGFYGNYNGAGYKISNLTVGGGSDDRISSSFWGNIGNTAVIRNMYIYKCRLRQNSKSILGNYLESDGRIINCVVDIFSSNVKTSVPVVYTNNGELDCIYTFLSQEKDIVSLYTEGSGRQIGCRILTNYIDCDAFELKDNLLNVTSEKGNMDKCVPYSGIKLWQIDEHGTITFGDYGKVSMQDFINYYIHNPLLFVSLIYFCVLIAFSVIKFFLRNNSAEININNLLIEITALLLFSYVFFVSITICKGDLDKCTESCIFNIVQALLILCVPFCFFRFRKNWRIGNLARAIKNNYIFVILIVVLAGVLIHNFDISPFSDADLYYGDFINAIRAYDYTFSGFLKSFCLWSKDFHIAALFMVIGEVISPGMYEGVYYVNCILLLFACCCVYELLGMAFKELTQFIKCILVCIFAFLPYVFTGVTYINADYYCMIFYIYFIFFLAKKCYVLSAVFGMGMMGMKENAILNYTILLLMIFISRIMDDWKKTLKEFPVEVYSLPLIGFLFIRMFINDYSFTGIRVDNAGMLDSVGRMLQYSGYGFIWIIELLGIVAIYFLIKTEKWKSLKRDTLVVIAAILVSSFLQILVFLGFQRLAMCPRYMAITMPRLIILMALFILCVPFHKFVKSGIGLVVVLVLIIESKYTVDPLILLTASKTTIDGNYELLHEGQLDKISDYCVYNYTYANHQRKLHEKFDKSNWTNDTVFVLCDETRYGLGIDGNDIYSLYWDTRRRHISYLNERNTYSIKSVEIKDGISLYEYYVKYRLDKKNIIELSIL